MTGHRSSHAQMLRRVGTRTGRPEPGSRQATAAGLPGTSRRRGATSVEMALVIMVFLMLMFGMLEMAIAVFRYHVVSQGARQAARLAIVHGELAPKGSNGTMTEWGPATFTSGANSGTEITEALKPYLAGVPLDKTTVTLEWLDGDTKLQSRVRATVVTAYQPFITFLFSSDWTLTGSSTMQIAH